jgi:hypothetical protein
MSAIKDGGPAFPREDYQTSNAPGQSGMTLRDYFAAKAVAGLCANQQWMETAHERSGMDMDFCVAAAAWEVADAVLVARAWGVL